MVNGQWSVINGGHSPQLTQFIIAVSRSLQAMHSSSVLLAGNHVRDASSARHYDPVTLNDLEGHISTV